MKVHIQIIFTVFVIIIFVLVPTKTYSQFEINGQENYCIYSIEEGQDGWLGAEGVFTHASTTIDGSHNITWGAYFDGATDSWLRKYEGSPLVNMHLNSNGNFIIQTDNNLTGSPNLQTKFIVNASGKVGIGTNNPDETLTVKGKIHAEEIIVDLNVSQPDYVFEEDYNLKPLAEVEEFIKANKHLPEIPSAKEVEKSGVSLGEMQAKLLLKIEELTLYTIEQNKKIEIVIRENSELKTQNKELTKRIEKLENN